MNAYPGSLVHRLVAARLGVATEHVSDEDRFEDVGLEPMDLLMIVLGLERFDRGQGDFPFAALEHATTVGDLVLLVDLWLQHPSGERTAANDAARRLPAPADARVG